MFGIIGYWLQAVKFLNFRGIDWTASAMLLIWSPAYFLFKFDTIVKRDTNAMAIEMGKKYFFLAITVSIAEHYRSSVVGKYGGDTLPPGASLTGNQTLISQSGKFELGFFSPSGTNNWYIGIWYAPISQKVIVWVANRDNPVINKPGVLKFSRDGHLRLLDRNGQSVWSTGIGERGSRAVLMESGNFIILDAHNKSAVIWESFRNPTDTLLPGMSVWKGMTLTSSRSSSDPARGLFSFRMDSAPGSTELFMLFNNTVPYWSSGECVGELGQNYFTKVPELEGQRKVQTSCVRLSPWKIYIHFGLNPIDHMITGRFLLNQMGEFELYFWMDDGRWSLRWSTYRGQCTDYEICGAYGLCNANDACSCVQGFTPKHDSQGGWWSTGCARQKPLQSFHTRGTTDDFLEAKNQYLPEREAVFINNEPTEQGCRAACLSNCSCTAFAFANSGPPVCRVWFGDLLGMSVTSKSQSVFIRLAASELQHSTSDRRVKASGLLIVPSTAAAFCVVSASVFGAFSLQKRRKPYSTALY